MALSIKTAEADKLARELAAMTGESLTEAVTNALRERLTRQKRTKQPDLVFAAQQLMTEFEPYRTDPRTADEIIGYDENGLP